MPGQPVPLQVRARAGPRVPWGLADIAKAIGLVILGIIAISVPAAFVASLVAGDADIDQDPDALAVVLGASLVLETVILLSAALFSLRKYRVSWADLGLRRPRRGGLWFSIVLVLAGLILVSSLFHFSDTQSKADDYSFVGFPAIWNLVAFYVFAFGLSPPATALLVTACVLLTFVPLKWVHPLRTSTLRPVTAVAVALGALAGAHILWSGFPAGPWAQAALLLAAGYGLGLTVYAGGAR